VRAEPLDLVTERCPLDRERIKRWQVRPIDMVLPDVADRGWIFGRSLINHRQELVQFCGRPLRSELLLLLDVVLALCKQ
jgi:hypothetical protein